MNLNELFKNKFLVFLSILFLLLSQYALQYLEPIWPKKYLLIAIIAIVILFSLSRISQPQKLARNTFILIFVVGTLNALILPVRYNLDENTHYYNVLQIADGKFRVQTSEVNFLMVSPDFLAITKLPSKSGYDSPTNTNLYSKEFLELENIPSVYSEEWIQKGGLLNPAYIPSAIGVAFGRVISNKIFVSYYMGRIFNVLFFALLAYLAVKISKRYKLQLFVLSTISYVLWITAGYSYDSLYYGLVLLMISQFTNFFEPNTITMKKSIAFIITCLGFILCKAPVILLMFLLLIIPNRYYANHKIKRLNIAFISLGLVFSALWVLQVQVINAVQKILGNSSEIISGAALGQSRLSYFISHPVYTFELGLRSLFDLPYTILNSISRPQPFLAMNSLMSTVNIVLFTFIFIIISYKVSIKLPRYIKNILLFLFLIISAGMIYAISGDTRVFKVGDLHVAGVQGRYHYYLLSFLPLLLSDKIKQIFNGSTETIIQKNEDIATNFVVKLVFISAIINSCIALFGYL
ncbi:MAG: DUF2142 domain-containing protein [Streptococcaceae bacterium]|nr:DUF2142 domain-containing protein [Streptococcaceae bacterium]MCH4176012.1 DUF2142 domain-containing protein [Streptococcaceae bacterium]